MLTFLALNPGCPYIQGLDSITVVLYLEFQAKPHLILSLLSQIYRNFLSRFLDDKHNLNFGYSALVLKRLVAFYEPELALHFQEIEFTHNMYLVGWLMTLFSHILPMDAVLTLWTHLFSHKVEYLFFFSLALLQSLKDKLLLLDLNATLSLINNI